MAQEQKKSIGGLYQKTSKKGLDFLSGYVEVGGQKVQVVAFKNAKKFTETTPDYSIYLSEPLNGPASNVPRAGQRVAQAPTAAPANRAAAASRLLEEDYNDLPYQS